MRINRKLIYKFVAAGSMPAVVAVIGVAVVAVPSPDAVQSIASLELSTRASSPNLIEVFTDGFDYDWNNAAIEAESEGAFKDFHDLTYTYSTHGSTTLGKTVGLGGFAEYNPAAIYERNSESAEWYETYWNDEMNRAMAKHLDVASNQFSKRAILGLVDVMANDESKVTWQGDATYARSFFSQDIAIMNWAGARNVVAGSAGVTSVALDALFGKALAKVSYASNANARGTRVLVQNNISHWPRKTSLNGDYSFNVSKREALSAQVQDLKNLIQDMKEKVDANGRSVYDNSMFVFWGDHGDHDKDQIALLPFLNNKARTRLMIKWPNVSKPALTRINDAVVSLGQMNYIIHDYFVSRRADPWQLFETAPFSVNRSLPFYFYDQASNKEGIVLASLQNGIMTPQGDLHAFDDPAVSSPNLTLNSVLGVDV